MLVMIYESKVRETNFFLLISLNLFFLFVYYSFKIVEMLEYELKKIKVNQNIIF